MCLFMFFLFGSYAYMYVYMCGFSFVLLFDFWTFHIRAFFHVFLFFSGLSLLIICICFCIYLCIYCLDGKHIFRVRTQTRNGHVYTYAICISQTRHGSLFLGFRGLAAEHIDVFFRQGMGSLIFTSPY